MATILPTPEKNSALSLPFSATRKTPGLASRVVASNEKKRQLREIEAGKADAEIGIKPNMPWTTAAMIRTIAKTGLRAMPISQYTKEERAIVRKAWLAEVKTRVDKMDRWDASAEVHLVSSFASVTTGTKELSLVGALKPGQNLRELRVVLNFTLATNSGGGTVIAADYNILGAAFYSKIRASLYGQSDMYNLLPSEARTMEVVFNNRDSAQQSLRIGQALTTTPVAFQLTYKIPFCFRGLEVPEIFAPSTDQQNLSGNKVDIDNNMTGLTTLSVAGATCTASVTSINLYYTSSPSYIVKAGPPMQWRSRQIAQSQDMETGQACDLFLGFEETVAASATRLSQITCYHDGRSGPENVDPITLATIYGETVEQMDALCPLDITGISNTTVGTQQGAQVVPLIWPDGRVGAGAYQWPTWGQSRIIYQLLASGGSAVVNLLYAVVRPIYEIQGSIVSLAAQNGIAISSIDDLAVDGGNDGTAMANFKGRLMMLKGALKR